MTYEEAKKDFLKFVSIKTSAASRPAFVDPIICAIDRQIPIEPIFVETYPKNLYLCPSCWSTFVTRKDNEMSFCNNCGQAIDWREEE